VSEYQFCFNCNAMHPTGQPCEDPKYTQVIMTLTKPPLERKITAIQAQLDAVTKERDALRVELELIKRKFKALTPGLIALFEIVEPSLRWWVDTKGTNEEVPFE